MKMLVSVFVMLGLLSMGAYGQRGATRETVDVGGQGGVGPVVSANGATLMRGSNGITISLGMPTPVPGSYDYPLGAVPGHPEVYTGWAFVFNHPDLCSDPCNGDDIGAATDAQGGVYNIAGHVSGGGNLQMVGHVSTGETPFGGAAHAPLQNPRGAEVHVAVAPHGWLDPSIMPDQIKTPIGNPAFWWVAFFIPAP
ncbi:MAG: hypothetical protein V7720_14490 [Halioglobus sp.]